MYDRIKPITYDVCHQKSEEEPFLLELFLNSKVGVINIITGFMLPCQYDSIIVSDINNYYIYGLDNMYGLMDSCGNCLSQARYDKISRYGDGLFLVKRDNKYGYLDTQGHLVIQFQYDIAYAFHDGLACVGKEIMVSYGNKKQKVIRFGLIDTLGNIVVKYKFNESLYFEEGRWILANKLYKEAYNKKGEAIPGTYEQIKQQSSFDYDDHYSIMDALDGEPDAYWNID